METFNLKEDYPPGMSKALIKKYGTDLHDLLEETNAEVADLEPKRHLLSVQGNKSSVEKTEHILNDLSKSLNEKAQVKQSDSMPDCPVCLSPIEPHSLYRLEYCGHAYCKECITQMFHVAIQSKSIPITCAMDGCDHPVVVKDILAIVGTNMTPLIEAALDQYVLTHKVSVLQYIKHIYVLLI